MRERGAGREDATSVGEQKLIWLGNVCIIRGTSSVATKKIQISVPIDVGHVQVPHDARVRGRTLVETPRRQVVDVEHDALAGRPAKSGDGRAPRDGVPRRADS